MRLPRSIRRTACFVMGHHYRIQQVFSAMQRRVVCGRCDGDWGMHDGVKAFVPWDGDLAQLYGMEHVAVNVNISGLDTQLATRAFESHRKLFG